MAAYQLHFRQELPDRSGKVFLRFAAKESAQTADGNYWE
jgi:hypothetical protein